MIFPHNSEDIMYHLAQQLRHSAVVALLSKSLAEEENSAQLLNQVSRTLMSVALMPAALE
jgi:Mn-containing catalase